MGFIKLALYMLAVGVFYGLCVAINGHLPHIAW